MGRLSPVTRDGGKKRGFRINSITKRWLINVLSVVVLSVVAAEAVMFFLIRNLYRDGARDAARDCLQPFESLAVASGEEFYGKAAELIKDFRYSSRMEVQIINSEGGLVLSTLGLAPSETGMPDYKAALSSPDGYATWEGKSDAGEKICAGTMILTDFGEGSAGAVRYIYSPAAVNRRIFVIYAISLAVGLVIIAIAALSGVYFVRGIVTPVKRVTEATRRIAAGETHVALKADGGDEIAELCESINEMADELRNGETLKNDFISGVSHELRTPLTAIKGWGETVLTSVGTDDEIVRHGTEIILDETDRLQGLVEELLDFSRMQSGKLTLRPEPVNVVEILESVTEMYREAAAKQNVELTYVQTVTSAVVTADKDRLRQVFINILDNAVKYSKDGGSVTVGAVTESGCVRVTVKDNGVGIAAKDLPHVKEKFYKANQKARGSGIGLALADEIIRLHKGLLLIESEEDVGTTVTVVLALGEGGVSGLGS